MIIGAFARALFGAALSAPIPARSAAPELEVSRRLGAMTLEEKLGQMVMVKWAGPAITEDQRRMLEEQGVGAVVVFGDSVRSPGQLRGLTRELHALSGAGLLVAVDQEGGGVDRFRAALGPSPSPAEVGCDPAAAAAAGRRAREDFLSLGFDLNLAPVVDLPEDGASPASRRRSFCGRRLDSSRAAAAYLEAFQAGGRVASVIKHFPSLPGDEDPHRVLARSRRSRGELHARELLPFRRLIASGQVRAVMVTHVLLPQVDPELPSTLSPRVIGGLLREDLGFEGVVVTDSLNMGALGGRRRGETAVLAALAGADLLMGPSRSVEVAGIIRRLAEAVESGRLSRAAVERSAGRVLALKARLGLLRP